MIIFLEYYLSKSIIDYYISLDKKDFELILHDNSLFSDEQNKKDNKFNLDYIFLFILLKYKNIYYNYYDSFKRIKRY